MDDYIREMERIRKEQPGTTHYSSSKEDGARLRPESHVRGDRFEAFTKDLSWKRSRKPLPPASTIPISRPSHLTIFRMPLVFLDHLVRGISVNGHSELLPCTSRSGPPQAGPLGLTYDKVRDLLAIVKKEIGRYSRDIPELVRGTFRQFPVRMSHGPASEKAERLDYPEGNPGNGFLQELPKDALSFRTFRLVTETCGSSKPLWIKWNSFLNQRLADSAEKVIRKPKTRPSRGPHFYFPDQAEISPCRIGLKASLLRFAENTPPYFVITTDQPLKSPLRCSQDEEFRGALLIREQSGRTLGPDPFGDPRQSRSGFRAVWSQSQHARHDDHHHQCRDKRRRRRESRPNRLGPGLRTIVIAVSSGIQPIGVWGGAGRIPGNHGRAQD